MDEFKEGDKVAVKQKGEWKSARVLCDNGKPYFHPVSLRVTIDETGQNICVNKYSVMKLMREEM